MNRPDRRTIAATCVLVGLLAQIAHAIVPARPSDFDGNGASEIVVFRPSDGTWHRQSPYLTMTFGGAGDVPVPADYSGDGVTDVAVYRPSNMTWYVAFITTVQWGAAGDVPVPADYNGDGRTDFAVFRPSDGSWWVYLSGSGPIGTVYWGGGDDIPVPADYNGDGVADIAVYRPSNGTWYVRGLGERFTGVAADAVPVPGDYNGDGLADTTIFSAATATWCLHPAQGAPACEQFGLDGDTPLAVDFNGDGRREVAVYRPSNGSWHGSGIGSTVWGVAGDLPVSAHARRPEAPVVSPVSGSYTSVQSVSATSATPGVTFRYTTDGTTPTFSSPVLPVPFTLSSSATLRVRAFKPGWLPSETATATYSFNFGVVPTPTATPSSGVVPPGQTITLSAMAGATITYTWGGAEPTATSTPYTGPIAVPAGVSPATLKAKAFRSEWTDSATLTQTYLAGAPRPGDFDGNGTSDIAVFRPSTGTWHFQSPPSTVGFGAAGDRPVPADYNRDGQVDVAIYRPSTGTWDVVGVGSSPWGDLGDLPVPGDYNGDGRADFVVFRPSTSTWYLNYVGLGTSSSVQLGEGGDVPVPGDYNGDGTIDIAAYRPSTATWFVHGLWIQHQFGSPNAVPVPGDYTGDGQWDFATYDPATGQWCIEGLPGPGAPCWQFGTDGDVPLAADFDGNGRADIAVYRPSNSTWHSYNLFGDVAWGVQGDIPIATRTFQPAAPAVTPGTGTYGTAQSVSATSSTPGVTLRYTTDGTTPTLASPILPVPLVIATGTTLKVRAFKPGWLPGSTTTVTYTFDYGVLPTPTALPAGGIVSASQTIALSGPSGATLHYTTDGSEPTTVSNVYMGPLTLPAGATTLKAKAFQPEWSPSATLTEAYTVDGTAPSIVATLFPYAVNGWHSGTVTVSFTCFDTSDIAACSAPSTVTAAGSTTVTGMATDLAGNTAQTSVVVQIDGTIPTLTLTNPAGDVTTTATSIELTGTVSDTGSGVAVAACNGAPMVPVGGVVSCTVPLRPGRNSVVLTARDVAGNNVSAGVRVMRTGTPTALTLSPGTRTLLVDEIASLSLLDDFGVQVQQAAWTTSDPAVVALTGGDPPVLTALAAGTATISASQGGLSAAATITVVAGTTLPDGTTKWTVDPPAGVSMGTMFAQSVDETVPDLFAVERRWATDEYQVRAIAATGEQRWQEAAPGRPVIGDTFGGLIAQVAHGLARFAGPAGAPPWRYDSPGVVYSPAQGADGTVYAIEEVRGIRSTGSGTTDDYAALVIDGTTGRLRARVPIPRGFADDYRCTYLRSDQPVDVTAPVVGESGSGYFQIARYRRVDVRNCDSPYPDSYISRTYSSEIQLLEVTPTGQATWRILHTITNAWLPETGQTIPDGLGGILTTWKRRENVYDNPQIDWTVTRFDEVGQRVDYAVSDEPYIQAIGDDGTAYLTTGTNTVHAVDVATWMAKWTAPPGYPIMAIAGGGVTVLDTAAGMLMVVDAMGAQRAVTPLSLASAVQARAGEWVGTTSTHTLAAVMAPFTIHAGSGGAELQLHPSFVAGGVSAQRTFAPKVPYPTIQRAAVKALQFYNPVAVRDNTEHAGSICRNPDGRYFSNIPNVSTFSDEVVPIFCTGGAQAGRYHTHGADGGAPSSVDLANANGDLDPFTGTHRPHFVADPCGSIYRYEGPNAASTLQVLPDRTESARACSPLQ